MLKTLREYLQIIKEDDEKGEKPAKVKPKVKNWVVRVYDKKNKVIATWKIKDRTEHEAEREASADIRNDYPNADDWSMICEQHEDEESENLPVRYAGAQLPMGRIHGLPHELEVKLMSEVRHLQSQPHKLLRLMNDMMPIMERIQAGEFLNAKEAEEFLNKYKEFDKDVNHPRYFKLMKEFLTTGNWNFRKFSQK